MVAWNTSRFCDDERGYIPCRCNRVVVLPLDGLLLCDDAWLLCYRATSSTCGRAMVARNVSRLCDDERGYIPCRCDGVVVLPPGPLSCDDAWLLAFEPRRALCGQSNGGRSVVTNLRGSTANNRDNPAQNVRLAPNGTDDG